MVIGRIFAFHNGALAHKGSLVQRELSAKLTEGLFYRSINTLANSTEVSGDFVVRNTNHPKSVSFHKSSTVYAFSA